MNIFIGNQKAQLQGQCIFEYALESNRAKDYEMLVEEMITKLN